MFTIDTETGEPPSVPYPTDGYKEMVLYRARDDVRGEVLRNEVLWALCYCEYGGRKRLKKSVMKKLTILTTMLAVLVAGCNGPTDAEKKIHQDQDNKEPQAEKVLDKKMPDFEIASKPKMSLKDQIRKYCDPETPTYKQGPKCSKAVAKFQDKAMAPPATIKMVNNNLSDDEMVALLSCQLTKYAEDHGQKAAVDYAGDILSGLMLAEYQHPKDSFDKQIKKRLEEEGAEPIYADKDHDTVQAQLIEEGYTCTLGEISKYR